ncbi:hypothetical protein [Devosia elaeis]|uniref:Uncharacterized protein n=1 Tax=Devosia elaeis TaxID=1770058 RepID=A0A178HNU4_9HYPH|nr:hypothetical protein [Devosia elaeis]OAM73738.1 hypothetical protein A3840_17235 [Devosia elaeis]
MISPRAYELHAQLGLLLSGARLGDSVHAATLTLAGMAIVAADTPEEAEIFLRKVAADAARVVASNWAMKPTIDAQVAAATAAANSEKPN